VTHTYRVPPPLPHHLFTAGGNLEKAQLGLAHSYSRAKVKFNVHRADNMIIQAIALLDQLDKVRAVYLAAVVGSGGAGDAGQDVRWPDIVSVVASGWSASPADRFPVVGAALELGAAVSRCVAPLHLSSSFRQDLNTFAMRVREWYGWHFPEVRRAGLLCWLFLVCGRPCPSHPSP
jgi:hypothetical protein